MAKKLSPEEKQNVLEHVRRFVADNPGIGMFTARKEIKRKLGYCVAFDTLRRWQALGFPDDIVSLSASREYGKPGTAARRPKPGAPKRAMLQRPQQSELEGLLARVLEIMQQKEINEIVVKASGEITVEQRRTFTL